MIPRSVTRTLIVDDEPAVRSDLREKLSAHPGIAVVGEAATVRSARVLLRETEYDLVFLDIQLIGGDSFQLVPDLRPGARIVFVTAHDRHAVRAFEINALDYLLKPVDPARLARCLDRIAPIEDDAPAAREREKTAAPAPLRPEDSIYLRSGARARFVRVSQILLIGAQDNYSEVLLDDGVRMLLRKSLKEWEDSLPPEAFMRVHRTQIVNLGRILRYRRDEEGRTHLTIEGVTRPVIASRHRWDSLRERLETRHRPL